MKIYNTATKKIEEFRPINPDLVSIYSCGPTVYGSPHIGNMRAYVFADVLKKYLNLNGYKTKHIINITDVGHLVSDEDDGEDKVEASAKKLKISAWDIAKKYSDEFFRDMSLLNCRPAELYPKATDHINEQIELISKLEEKGFTYRITDGVYFDISKYSDYGLFSNEINSIKNKSRISDNPEKRNPHDFALWKFSKVGETRQMEWPSPWGKGFPGWHIECSAMSMKYLGHTIDIHTGGVDHIKVHHQNEIAQSECATGHHFVNYWMHIEFLKVYNQKMSKSLGNVYTISDIVEKKYNPLALRYLYLTSRYSTHQDFTFESLDFAQKSLYEIYDAVSKLEEIIDFDSDLVKNTNEDSLRHIKEEIIDCMEPDLNTAKLLAKIWIVIKSKDIENEMTLRFIEAIDGVTSLNIISSAKDLRKNKENNGQVDGLIDIMNVTNYNITGNISSDEFVNLKTLVERRIIARQNKNWLESDQIRDQIRNLGFELVDADGKTYLKKIN